MAAADLVIVNKIDLPEANRLMKDVREEVRANTKFLGVQARTGDGVEAVLDALLELDAAGREPQRLQDRRRRRVVGELRRAAASLLERRIERSLRDRATTDLLDRLERGDTTLTAAVAHLLQEAAENTQT